ncbi:hypothetical protein E2C01_075492 [Portunus trituberculatus]|uniref:Uncharacterized protein n=1 Tax=Portunus trituberculatus TaxID=210409 RepID=A0A5B7IF68_PORTR|nr:hypothetical protein [Portunus trituberculatus]
MATRSGGGAVPSKGRLAPLPLVPQSQPTCNNTQLCSDTTSCSALPCPNPRYGKDFQLREKLFM